MIDTPSFRHDRAFFGRRKGKKLSDVREDLIDHVLPRLRVPVTPALDPRSLFSEAKISYRLEIGFGGGEHLLHQARLHPDIGFIGCEPFVNGMAKMLAAIEREAIKNIRLFDSDAVELLKTLVPDGLDGVDLLYPDPWPKRRQHKRRFVSDVTINLIAKALKRGGLFRFASDIDHYVGWTLAHIFNAKQFQWTATTADDWRLPWPEWIETRYEAKARREGRQSSYLIFKKI